MKRAVTVIALLVLAVRDVPRGQNDPVEDRNPRLSEKAQRLSSIEVVVSGVFSARPYSSVEFRRRNKDVRRNLPQ